MNKCKACFSDDRAVIGTPLIRLENALDAFSGLFRAGHEPKLCQKHDGMFHVCVALDMEGRVP